jgi:hypothetical protein
MRHDLCANLSATFHKSDHHGFVVIYSSSEFGFACLVHVPSFAADECFVHFDFAVRAGAEFASEEIVLESEPKALQHEPRGLLRNTQSAVNLHAGDAIFAIDQEPKSRHPFVESERRILEHRSQFQGELFLAFVAKPDAASLDERVLGLAATGANDLTIRPAQFLGVLESAIRVGEVNDGFLESVWGVHV